MNNTRFATAVHIMTLLADSPEEWLTSEWMAGSININPVVVRKEGGSQLSRNASEIRISDIYSAVKNTEVLGKKNLNPNPACNVGKEINNHLNTLFSETEKLVIQFLGDKTLQEFCDQFN